MAPIAVLVRGVALGLLCSSALVSVEAGAAPACSGQAADGSCTALERKGANMLQKKVQEHSVSQEVEWQDSEDGEVLQEADEFEQESEGQSGKVDAGSAFWHRRRRRRRNDFCGHSTSWVNKYLSPPPEVQRIMRFMLGTSWGVNTPKKSFPCWKLPLNQTAQYIIIVVGQSLLQGVEAEEKRQEVAAAGGKTGSTDSTFKSAVNILTDDPFCIALRMCDQGDVTQQRNSWLKVWDFGFYHEAGFVIYSAPPVTLKLMGVAFSSAGNLQVGRLDAPLWRGGGARQFDSTTNLSTNLHWWFRVVADLPVGKTKMINAEIEGNLGAYAEVDGSADIAKFLSFMVGVGDMNMLELINSIPTAFLFRVVGWVEVTLSFDLRWLFGIKEAAPGDEPKTFRAKAYASALWEAQLKIGKPHESYVGTYFSLKAELSLTELLKVADFVKKLFNFRHAKATLTADLQFFFTIAQSGSTTGGFRVGMQAELSCGFLREFPDEVFIIFPLMQGLKDACSKKHLETSLELVGVDGDLSEELTCFTVLGNRYCLSQLPTCPAPVSLHGKCSLNSDCTGSQYGPTQQGYCKSQNALRTTAFCTGKCEKLAKAGECCSADTTNTWQLPTSAEDEKCEVHWQGVYPACLCATCAGSDGKLDDGTKCATDNNCRSGYCHKGNLLETVVNQGCEGTCKSKISNGHSCSFDAECTSGHCSVGCRDLFDCTIWGKCVQCLASEHCGSEQYCDGHSCHNKRDYLASTNKHWKCKSNRDVCGRCAWTNGLVYGGYRCSVDSDCGWGWGCGAWWQNCWGCRCHCR